MIASRVVGIAFLAVASAGLMRSGHPIERLMTSSNAGFQVIPP
jgi:hypothetical protein